MRPLFSVSLFACVPLCVAGVASCADEPAPDSIAGQRLDVRVVQEEIIRRDPEEALRFLVSVTNPGPGRVDIIGNTKSCGCLEPDGIPSRIEVGETSTFQVLVQPRGRRSPFTERLDLLHADRQETRIVLATSAPSGFLFPGDLIRPLARGVGPEGGAFAGEWAVSSFDLERLSLLEFSPRGSETCWIRADWGPIVPGANGAFYRVLEFQGRIERGYSGWTQEGIQVLDPGNGGEAVVFLRLAPSVEAADLAGQSSR